MSRHVITIPRRLARSMQINWQLQVRVQSIGATANDINQAVVNAFPRFIGQPQLHLHREAIRAWRSVLERLEGRTHLLRMPMIDPISIDYDKLQAARGGRRGIPYSEGQRHDNGRGLEYTPLGLAKSSAVRGDTELQINVGSSGLPITLGQRISHDNWPMSISAILARSGSVYTCTVAPAIRSAAIAVDDILVLEGYGLFELAEDNAGFPGYGRSQLAQPQVPLIEALRR